MIFGDFGAPLTIQNFLLTSIFNLFKYMCAYVAMMYFVEDFYMTSYLHNILENSTVRIRVAPLSL